MEEVSPINRRKSDHIRINLEENVKSGLSTGLEQYRFIHQALPELDLKSIDSSLVLFGKRLKAPILISSMTGGTTESMAINQHLAEAAQVEGVAMGVGSQRIALEKPELVYSFSGIREKAPDILLFANLGAVQLNFGYTIDQCQAAVDMIQADGIFLHLNPLQEALQNDGNTNFSNLARKIEQICRLIEVPVLVKEVGWGISCRTAKILAECGVSAIDVSGAGGTSWSKVEMNRASNIFIHELADTFSNWGIPTVDSILNVLSSAPGLTIFASGGIRNGLDIAKCVALGATLGGMARAFLRAGKVNTEATIELLQLLKRQIELTMFATSSARLEDLRKAKLEKIGNDN